MRQLWVLLMGGVVGLFSALAGNYPVIDTGQDRCYDELRPIDPPRPDDGFFGQDAQYQGIQPSYRDNGDGTVSDLNTGLMWQKAVPLPKSTMEEALEVAEELELAGHSDWRLPNAKELHSIVDYSRSPDTTDSPAIDPVFESTEIKNEAGQNDWGHYWTSTTHLDGPNARQAVYFCFGRGMEQMHGQTMDVHGAGAQRSDPKTGEADDIGLGHGPQGDARRTKNFVRTVRGGGVQLTDPPDRDRHEYPEVIGVDGKRLQPEPMEFKKIPGGAQPGNAYQETPDSRFNQDKSRASMGRQHPFFKRFDKNSDGEVSRREFTGPADHFQQFDKNSDGVIEASEAPTGPPPGR